MSKYITIKDIANELGISKSTVSRALSGDSSNVKAETMQLITETARRMGYHRNEMAVSLRKQSSHNIGIIIPEIVTSFYMTFISHVQAILREHGYNVLIAASNESYKQERENIDMMERCMVDGLLISVCDKDRNADIYRRIMSHGTPMVFFDRTVESIEASQVRLDDYIMSFFMVEQLIRSGCRQIVHIPGPSRIRNGYERLRGYRDALEKFHIAYNPDLVLPPALSAEEGSQVMSNFLAKNIAFDAVFGFTETALLGAKNLMQKRGLHIPEDVCVCCMAGTTLCTLVHPTITAVEQPVEQMTAEACRLLMAKISDSDKQVEDVVLRGEIVERESTVKRDLY
ncbi:LacI family DNA-binding transcriptional regulator [Prevotella merdae]|uniref:LacI family DNA-binding transcriptional regulator n=1 Tax=Prevotella merdae TaxID=2079531 RepID=UPI003F7E4C72